MPPPAFPPTRPLAAPVKCRRHAVDRSRCAAERAAVGRRRLRSPAATHSPPTAPTLAACGPTRRLSPLPQLAPRRPPPSPPQSSPPQSPARRRSRRRTPQPRAPSVRLPAPCPKRACPRLCRAPHPPTPPASQVGWRGSTARRATIRCDVGRLCVCVVCAVSGVSAVLFQSPPRATATLRAAAPRTPQLERAATRLPQSCSGLVAADRYWRGCCESSFTLGI